MLAFCTFSMQMLHSTESTEMSDDMADDTVANGNNDVTIDEMNDESTTVAGPAVDDYMPVRKIVSDKEQMKQDELVQNVYTAAEPVIKIKTKPASLYSIPIHLTAYAFDLGDISSFPSPKKCDNNKLGRNVINIWHI